MTPSVKPEPLPEYVHQTLPISRLKQAIESLEHARETATPREREILLRRADESLTFAYYSARNLMAMWRDLNAQCRDLGILACYGEPVEAPSGPEQMALFGGDT